ncbi:MAG: alpha/beta hydrolase [Pyrinomonadaceae bacterium]
MMKTLFLGVTLSCTLSIFAQQPAQTLPTNGVTGIVKRHENFSSRFVDARNVDVWLPAGYDRNKLKRYPVVYMHDGQMLFDATTTWNHQEWGIDETMTRLIGDGRIREAIVVGVWNTPKRFAEYMPQKAVTASEVRALKDAPAVKREQIASDNYLKFLVYEMKPFIDATYRTLPGRKDTFIMGSSMGGLISAYAMSEYPNIFGGGGCISTHFPAGDGIVIDYLKTHLPDARTHKFYFDYGTETLDANYEPYQLKMNEVMRNAGYKEGENWVTKKFLGADHTERSWSKRVDIPLIFLLHK